MSDKERIAQLEAENKKLNEANVWLWKAFRDILDQMKTLRETINGFPVYSYGQEGETNA